MSTTTVPAVLAAAGGVALAHSVLPDHWLPLAVLARTRRDRVATVARLAFLAGSAHVVVSAVLGAVVILVGLSLRGAVEAATDLIVGGVLILTGLALLLARALGRGHHGHDDHTHEQHGHDDHDYGDHTHDDHGHDHTHDDHDDHGHDDHTRDHHAPGGVDDGHENDGLDDPRGPRRHAHDHGTGHAHDHGTGHLHGPGRRRGLAVLIPFGVAASPDLTILPVFLAASALGPGAAVAAVGVFAVVTVAAFVALTTAATAGVLRVRGDWLDRHGAVLTAAVLLVLGTLIAVHLL